MSAVENLALGVGFANPRWIRWRHEVREARRRLAELDIHMDVEAPLAQARAVERTAVAIARALRRTADDEIRLLVLDEPTAALPPHEVELLFSIVRQARERGIAIIYVSHRLDEIEVIADEVLVLRNGALVGRLTQRDKFERNALVEIMLGGATLNSGQVASPTLSPAARATGAQPALEVRDLKTTALCGVSFAVARGEIVGVAGIDGSGREDLARALIGAHPVSGEIVINGRRLSRISPAAAASAGLALVPSVTEAGSAIAQFTLKENLTLARLPRLSSWWGVRTERENAEALGWIDRLDIRPPDPSRQMSLLSGGNRQKVVMAKWLSLGSHVYVLSEPTAGVDVGARVRIYEFLRAQAAQGQAFVVCSTDLEELEAVCSRVLVLRAGSVAAELCGSAEAPLASIGG
jgi:ribose transport system ATP-binding protein